MTLAENYISKIAPFTCNLVNADGWLAELRNVEASQPNEVLGWSNLICPKNQCHKMVLLRQNIAF